MNAFNQAKLQVGRRRANVLQEYGYAADFDDKGNMTNMRIDPTSQYGRFQRMMKSHGSALDQAGDQSLARGLGTGGGLGAQAEASARDAMGADQAGMGRELSGTMGDLSEMLVGAESQYNSALSGIDYEEAEANWQNENWEKAQAAQAAQAEEQRQQAAAQLAAIQQMLSPKKKTTKSSLPKSLTALKRKRLTD